MLKFTSIVGYTSCGPTYIESFLTIFGQCINVLNYKYGYDGMSMKLGSVKYSMPVMLINKNQTIHTVLNFCFSLK